MKKHRIGRRRSYKLKPDELESEMSEGGVVSEGRGGGYDASLSGKHLGSFKNRGAALAAIVRKMDQDQFYGNIFTVNDHGNVTQLAVRLHPKGKGVLSRAVHSWV
jgi:hypothetical protein